MSAETSKGEQSDPEDALNFYNVTCDYSKLDDIEKGIDCPEQSASKGM